MKRRARKSILLSFLLAPVVALAASLVEWVDYAPVTDTTRIALGYPVPIPVDTPLPFDGFRSYEGLHMRHQDLALTTPWVHGSVIGSTFRERPVWVYQLGDENLETAYGLPEQAMLSNGGIHAREWQSPEVATGIIELLAVSENDHYLVDYLRENANVLVIPVLNVDGFLQTQRYPSFNWVGADPRYPESWPRDGRMRRKNMRGADEILVSENDHLQGIDLNRNNAPYWASSGSSSFDTRELVYHGAGPASEPETRALDAAAQLGPIGRLSMFTDIHSFSQVHFWDRSSNERLTALTERLLRTFSQHHESFPAGKFYYYDRAWSLPVNQGIGTTAEYFTHTYQVPSWTLEIEPSGGEHDGLPGGGADYGGLGRNGHDGFILPDSEVERVRTELAQTFAIAYYQQSGPPSIQALRLTDTATGAVVIDMQWDTVDDNNRGQYLFQAQPLQLGREYSAWVAWNKPMRWREDGLVTPLPGKGSYTQNMERTAESTAGALTVELGDAQWLSQPGDAPGGYLRYRDDAVSWTLSFPADATNLATVQGVVPVTLGVSAYDLVGVRNDANPATVVNWSSGSWAGYEDAEGNLDNDIGGIDKTVGIELTSEDLGEPFLVEPGISAAWYDPERDGEGFMLEVLPGNIAVMYWFTYDQSGQQDWYIASGEVRGNRMLFPELMSVSGGEFGPDFDPDKVVRTPVGTASFTWTSCDSGVMDWVIDGDGSPRRQGRMTLIRLTDLAAPACIGDSNPPVIPETIPVPDSALLSGSWYDPSHSGEGYVLQMLNNGQALVYWFSYDPEGNRRWFFGIGDMVEQRLIFNDMRTASGAMFGDGFDPEAVELAPWGSLELELGCDTGTARFQPAEEGFPAGELDLVRLTALDGLACPGN